MIPKIPKKRGDGKSSFRTLVNYIAGEDHPDKKREKDEQRAVYVGRLNIEVEENWLAAREMEALAGTNTRCRDPVFHYILSFRPQEIPTPAQVDEAVEISLKALNLENCKALYALQNDTGIHHIHVCVCRIDTETGRAIDPAGGWTKKALAKAARQIEVTQGWDVLEQDPFWNVKDGKIVEKSKQKDDEKQPKLDTKAQDLEAHTGEKSAQRIAMERGAEIIRNARSWEELHKKLSAVGLRFERKGSGAVIVVNDKEIVKASVIGRDCSLSKLEKRLGEFSPTKDNELPSTSRLPSMDEPLFTGKPEPTEQTKSTVKILSSWERYQIYKTEFNTAKELKNALFTKHKSERQELKAKHKREREKLFKSRSWTKQGKELNLQRSLLAGNQLRERLLIKKAREAEIAESFPVQGKFLSYRKWLAANEPERIPEIREWKAKTQAKIQIRQKGVIEMDESKVLEKEQNTENATELSFSEPEMEQLRLQNQEAHEKAETPIIPDMEISGFSLYQQTINEDKTISYSLRGKPVSFTDKGKEIQLHKIDESSILASLQLANQKWGGAKIQGGSKEHIQLCEKLARQYKLKIQLPKEYLLEQEKEKEKENEKKIDPDKKSERKTNDVNLAPFAIPFKTYRGVVIASSGNGESISLRTEENEIVRFKMATLSDIPHVGEKIEVEELKKDEAKRKVTSFSRENERGR